MIFSFDDYRTFRYNIINFFQLYILTKNGMKFSLLGKNLIRIYKTFRHYQCMKDSKN